MVAAPFSGPALRWPGFVSISALEMGVAVAAAIGIVLEDLVATEVTKRVFFRPRSPARA